MDVASSCGCLDAHTESFFLLISSLLPAAYPTFGHAQGEGDVRMELGSGVAAKHQDAHRGNSEAWIGMH